MILSFAGHLLTDAAALWLASALGPGKGAGNKTDKGWLLACEACSNRIGNNNVSKDWQDNCCLG